MPAGLEMVANWKRALQLFESVVDLGDEERMRLLAELEAGDAGLAVQLRALLDADMRNADNRLDERVQAAIAAPGAAAEDASGFDVGQSVGPYRLLRAIGSGGMASVWLAEREDGPLRRNFALKLPHPGSMRRGFAERFARERDILARLRHAHIARLHDAGVDSAGQPYLALDHIEGEPITQWCDARNLPFRARLQLFEQVLDAVQFAHANLVIHRDLKPGNILVDTQGEVSLLDFGIARLLDATDGHVADTALTEAGSRVLTVQYASPEQIRGESLTIASDIYSLGVVLHELIAGARPYRLAFNSAAQLEQAISDAAREPLTRQVTAQRAQQLGLHSARAMRRAVGGDLDAIVARAMAESPSQRYASAAALSDDLRRLLDGRTVEARRPYVFRSALRFARRHALASTIVSVLLVALIASSVLAFVTAQRERNQRERAEAAREFLIGVFAQANPDENKGQPFTAAQLLEKGERQLDSGASRPPALQVELTSLIGDLYWNIGEFARAETLLERAVASADDSRVPDDVRALALLRLARTELSRNANEAAIDYATRAIHHAQRATPTRVIEMSSARRLIAEAVIAQGAADRALPLLEVAMAADVKAFGMTSEAVAADWELLAMAYKELSRYDEAIAAARHAIDALTAAHGREHSSVINALGALSSALAHNGDAEGAIVNLRESAAIAARLYGPEHRETIVQRSNLYIALNRAGRSEEALRGHLELLEIVRRSMADTRPEQLAYIHGALAAEYRGLSRFEESAVAAREAVATWARIKNDDDSVAFADPLWSLGVAELMLGRYAEAQATLGRAIAIADKHQAADSQWRAMYRGYLSITFRHAGQPREALAEIEAALAAIGEAARKPTPIPVFLQATLAEAQLDTGDAAAALATAQRSLEMARNATAANAQMLRAPLFALARALAADGRAAEAEPLLREALADNRPPLGERDPRILELEVELVRACTSSGRADEAEALRDALTPRLQSLDTAYTRELLRRLDRGR